MLVEINNPNCEAREPLRERLSCIHPFRPEGLINYLLVNPPKSTAIFLIFGRSIRLMSLYMKQFLVFSKVFLVSLDSYIDAHSHLLKSQKYELVSEANYGDTFTFL